MTELWERFHLQELPEEHDLDRARFEDLYRGRGPVVVRGGARDMPAFDRWDAPYLSDRAGRAEVTVATYAADRRDFGSIASRNMPLSEFLSSLGDANADEVRYLFNNASCIFLRNEDQPRYHVGWTRSVNAGLAVLGPDFRVPAFVDPDRFVCAVVILGSQENATDLHYDNGGEGKVLVQLRGRKRIMLLPPSSAQALRLRSLFFPPAAPVGYSGSRPALNIHAEAAEEMPDIHGYRVDLEQGDIAYWPPFWFHDVANLDPYTLAVGVMVDEVAVPAMLLRHLSHGIFRELLSAARGRLGDDAKAGLGGGWKLAVAIDGKQLGSLTDLFRDVEQKLLAEAAAETVQLWEWNDRLGRD